MEVMSKCAMKGLSGQESGQERETEGPFVEKGRIEDLSSRANWPPLFSRGRH